MNARVLPRVAYGRGVDRLAAWWSAWTGGGTRAVLAVDVPLALMLGGLAALGSWEAAADHGLRLGPAGFGLVVVATAALAVRRRWPLVALGVSLGATLAYLTLGYPYSSILQLTAAAAYSVGAWCSGRVSLAAVLVSVGIHVSIGSWLGGTPWPAFGTVPLALVWLVLPWLAGVAVRGYRRVRERAAEAERQGHAYRERLRMAQEVHDIVGHSLAVINMQAGVALHVLDRRPERAAEVLRTVRETSAQALAELRFALGDPAWTAVGPEPGRRPLPGLEGLAALVEATEHDGLTVRLVVSGQRMALPAAIDLTGYRTVQESLTNVVRHAAANRATVEIGYGPDAVTVTVTDDGRGPAPAAGAGRGLVGMRERVTAVGGTLTTGPGPAGGFRVHAVLPLTDGGDVSTAW